MHLALARLTYSIVLGCADWMKNPIANVQYTTEWMSRVLGHNVGHFGPTYFNLTFFFRYLQSSLSCVCVFLSVCPPGLEDLVLYILSDGDGCVCVPGLMPPPLIESGSSDDGGGVDRDDDTSDDDDVGDREKVAAVDDTSDRNDSPVHRSPSPASACHSLEWDSNGDDFLAADCRQLHKLCQPIQTSYGTQGN